MNYKAELRGFAFDRASNHFKNMGATPSLKDVLETADRLVEYFYIPDRDFADTAQHIMPLAEDADLDALAEVVNLLTNIHQRRTAHAERIAAKFQPKEPIMAETKQ